MNTEVASPTHGEPSSTTPEAFNEARHSRRAPETTGFIHRIASILCPLDLPGLFARGQPVEVELGSGDGSFLTQYAAAHAEVNFLGVERLLGRLRKINRKGSRLGLTNLILVRIEASYLLEFLLPRGSVEALHVYFPDPWPKRKHRRHRLVNERFPELAARSLAPEGRVYLRTDHAEYFEQMIGVFGQHSGFQQEATPDELGRHKTDFERGFTAAGIQTRHAAYRLRPPRNPSGV